MSDEFKNLKKKLLTAKKNGYDRVSDADRGAMEEYCAGYMAFLNRCKTERLCAAEAIRMAEEKGYKPYARGRGVSPGDKLYVCNRGKSVTLFHIGKRPLSDGIMLAAAHIDSPRLDLKPTPLYEESELAFFKTHYYGGIRKYQWVTIPLELRGVVAMKDGRTIPVNIGAEPGDPKLVITDLLPHLGQEQAKKPLATAIPAETLNLLVGSRPVGDEDDKGRVKLAVMKLLNEKYGITEDDFNSAELEAVPASPACEIGLDRSMIGAYGHDDRVCAYAVFKALLDLSETPEKTAVCMLADKEEIGSEGVTGMRSAAFDAALEDLCAAQGVALRECREKSFCLSADVTAAFDPDYADVFDKRNAAFLNYGVGLCKYTGARGKSGASDADAETVAFARRVFDEAGVVWQIAELGKVDAGGGGTVAAYMAQRNITTLDAGVPVLSMHAPFETVAKLDCYQMYKGAAALYRAAFA
ncbi:MAG: aminopeptidase [Oscillibacter sp.]|nr:aminopeptidase [Oscillibacter sp.]